LKRTVRYATKLTFINLQRGDRIKGIRRNREVKAGMLKAGVKYPVSYYFLHKSDEVRVVFVADEHGTTFMQDMPLNAFDALPTLELNKKEG